MPEYPLAFPIPKGGQDAVVGNCCHRLHAGRYPYLQDSGAAVVDCRRNVVYTDLGTVLALDALAFGGDYKDFPRS